MEQGRKLIYWRTLAVAVLMIVVGAVLIYFESFGYIKTAKQNALQIASAEASVLSQRLNESISLTYTLEALLREKNFQIGQNVLDTFSSHLLESHPSVSNLQYAPKGIVTFISPMAGNEAAVGHNLLADPKRNKEAYDSVEKKMLTVAGPFELIQGGVALVARLPIFEGENGSAKFWGFSTVLIKISDLMNSTTISSLTSLGYAWNIYRIHPDTKQPDVFYGTTQDLLGDSVQLEVKAPNAIWYLNVAPSKGWLYGHSTTIFVLSAVWLVISLAASVLACKFFRQPLELQKQVALRTAELQEAKDVLAQSEQRLVQIAENSQMWIWEVDEDGLYTYCSNACEPIFGLRADEIVGIKHFYDLFHPQDREDLKEKAFEVFDQKGSFKDFENRNITKTGEVVWLSTSGAPILENGQLVGYRGADIDITTRKKLAEEHTRATQLAALGTVAAGVAHEINNPIQGIMNYAALIEKDPQNLDRIQKASAKIVQESVRIANITQNLLNYSKDARIEMVQADVSQVVADALSLTSTKIRHSGILLKVDLPSSLPHINIQPQSIQQVILNLVDNAADALAETIVNEEKKIITVKTCLVGEDQEQAIRIIVSDNGIGMSQHVLERAFEAFYTTKPPSRGTGLGLSIVNDIVSKHAGSLSLESDEGKGTSVIIDIPVA